MKRTMWINILILFTLTISVKGNEIVYLHLDQSGYYLDETIWFKAYVIDANNHCLTSKSEVLYVELLSPEGYVVETK